MRNGSPFRNPDHHLLHTRGKGKTRFQNMSKLYGTHEVEL